MFPPLSPVSNIWIAMLQDLQGWEEHHSAGGPETTHEPAVQCASWGELLYIITCTYIFIQSYSRYVCRDCMHTHTHPRACTSAWRPGRQRNSVFAFASAVLCIPSVLVRPWLLQGLHSATAVFSQIPTLWQT